MNQWAAKLGMNDTHFVNAHGLYNVDHYSTAHDMARLGQALIRDLPNEYAIYSQKDFTFNGITSTTVTVCCGIKRWWLMASKPVTSAKSAIT
jgi:penicillin-binding protein 6. Serine peptidase. MEROPS family S11